MSAGSAYAATGSSRPSVISTSIELAPRSTAANRRPGLSSTSVERRPPRLAAGPASRTRPIATRASSSVSRRGRGTTSRSASSARESAPVSRSRRSSRGCTGPSTALTALAALIEHPPLHPCCVETVGASEPEVQSFFLLLQNFCLYQQKLRPPGLARFREQLSPARP